jgi:hypothetical protein
MIINSRADLLVYIEKVLMDTEYWSEDVDVLSIPGVFAHVRDGFADSLHWRVDEDWGEDWAGCLREPGRRTSSVTWGSLRFNQKGGFGRPG